MSQNSNNFKLVKFSEARNRGKNAYFCNMKAKNIFSDCIKCNIETIISVTVIIMIDKYDEFLSSMYIQCISFRMVKGTESQKNTNFPYIYICIYAHP